MFGRHEAALDDADEDVQSRERVCKDQDTRDLDRGVLALTFSHLVMAMMMMTLRVDDLI